MASRDSRAGSPVVSSSTEAGKWLAMPRLPEPRGAVSHLVLDALRGQARTLAPLDVPVPPDPLGDDDLHLALYALYELHYRGFDGVDERWEWAPSVLALRSVLEDIFEGGLYEAIGPPDEGARLAPEDMDIALRGVAEAEDAPSLSSFLEREGTREHFREFV